MCLSFPVAQRCGPSLPSLQCWDSGMGVRAALDHLLVVTRVLSYHRSMGTKESNSKTGRGPMAVTRRCILPAHVRGGDQRGECPSQHGAQWSSRWTSSSIWALRTRPAPERRWASQLRPSSPTQNCRWGDSSTGSVAAERCCCVTTCAVCQRLPDFYFRLRSLL